MVLHVRIKITHGLDDFVWSSLYSKLKTKSTSSSKRHKISTGTLFLINRIGSLRQPTYCSEIKLIYVLMFCWFIKALFPKTLQAYTLMFSKFSLNINSINVNNKFSCCPGELNMELEV